MGNNQYTPGLSDSCWWKEAVVYQIYPRSFMDSNGDGIGDLKGITSKLDYIKDLGVDVVWLNPIFASPNDDNGYDISDYREIMSDFGNMQDFDELLEGMHARGIRLVLDLVVNHSSDEHPWFVQSRSSCDSSYRNYYHWWPEEKGTPPARYSIFDVENNAWMYDAHTKAWYLHYFSRKQPDLNWENPLLREEIYEMMRFWFGKGIDGFRMDVISFISKDTSFPELEFQTDQEFLQYYAKGPHLHDYLQEMNEEVLRHYDIMTVAEGAGVISDDAIKFVDPDRKELNMLYHFEGTDLKPQPGRIDPGYDLSAFKDIYTKWDQVYENTGWGTIYLGNHDQPRMVSRWGNDTPGFRFLSSKMLSTFLLTMRSTPYVYAGDELGMANIRFKDINEYNDIATLNRYHKIEAEGGDTHAFLEEMKDFSRDNARTPFQWDNSEYAGFTKGIPWISLNPDYLQVNAKIQETDPDSVLNYFRRLVHLRKQHKALIYGKYSLLDKENPKVYAYSRSWENDTYLVLLNFSKSMATFNIPWELSELSLLLGNYNPSFITDSLQPFEAIVAKVIQRKSE
ncbi:MAG: alpha-glucosidase [Bacteroidales bacterium]|nr:alpha-glucosidase [Bacteroidales bacterium]